MRTEIQNGNNGQHGRRSMIQMTFSITEKLRTIADWREDLQSPGGV